MIRKYLLEFVVRIGNKIGLKNRYMFVVVVDNDDECMWCG